jgi:hypothetical protein
MFNRSRSYSMGAAEDGRAPTEELVCLWVCASHRRCDRRGLRRTEVPRSKTRTLFCRSAAVLGRPRRSEVRRPKTCFEFCLPLVDATIRPRAPTVETGIMYLTEHAFEAFTNGRPEERDRRIR